jgi:hypothetical protein
LLPEGTEL